MSAQYQYSAFAVVLVKFLMLLLSRCPTLQPIDCSLLGSSVHGILQAKMLERVAMPSSRGSFWPRDWTQVSCIARWILYHWATWLVPLVKFLGFVRLFLVSLFQEFWCPGVKNRQNWNWGDTIYTLQRLHGRWPQMPHIPWVFGVLG